MPVALAAAALMFLAPATSVRATPGIEPGPGYILSIYALGTAFAWWLIAHPDDPTKASGPPAKKPSGSRVVPFGIAPSLPSGDRADGVAKVAVDYGTLTAVPGSENAGCLYSDAVAFHPSSQFVYFAGGVGSPGVLCGYRIDPITGAYTPVPGSPVATANLPTAVAVEPAGNFVYVAGTASNNIWGYTIDRTTGTPTAIAGFPLATGGFGPNAIAIDRGGRFAYVANESGNGGAGSIGVFAVNRSTGAWTPIAGSPFEMDPVFNDRARSLALSPDGRFLFVGGSVGVHSYSINANSGALSLFAQRDLVFPGGVAVDPTGRFLYVPDYNAYLVRGFAIGANGTLTPAGTQPYGTPNPTASRGIAILGDLVYVANTSSQSVYGFRIQPATGALSPVAGSPFATGTRSFALAGHGVLQSTLQVDTGDSVVAPLGAFGGRPPYTYAIPGGTLPPGLSLNEKTGVIAGVAAASGTYTFTAQVTDSANVTAAHDKTIFVGTSAPATPITVVEFHNAALDHYFITYVADEIAKLDNGTFKGWTRTGLSFNAYATAQSGTAAVCRIYIPPGKGDGHFFGRDANECAGTIGKNPSFMLESDAFFFLHPPVLGTCAAGQVPVYRVFSNRADANHRYTTLRSVRDQMVDKGWLAEGDGADLVVMCAPS